MSWLWNVSMQNLLCTILIFFYWLGTFIIVKFYQSIVKKCSVESLTASIRTHRIWINRFGELTNQFMAVGTRRQSAVQFDCFFFFVYEKFLPSIADRWINKLWHRSERREWKMIHKSWANIIFVIVNFGLARTQTQWKHLSNLIIDISIIVNGTRKVSFTIAAHRNRL